MFSEEGLTGLFSVSLFLLAECLCRAEFLRSAIGNHGSEISYAGIYDGVVALWDRLSPKS